MAILEASRTLGLSLSPHVLWRVELCLTFMYIHMITQTRIFKCIIAQRMPCRSLTSPFISVSGEMNIVAWAKCCIVFGPGNFYVDPCPVKLVGRMELHGKTGISWTRLVETAAAGSNLLKLEEAVDWEVGVEVVITPTERGHQEEASHRC